MTVISASGLLFEWFRQNDTFCINDDFQRLTEEVDEVQNDRDQAAVLASLADMCTHEILSYSVIGEKPYYVLKKPLDSYDQTLEVDYPTANLIASTLNSLCGRLDGFAENADPMSLKVKDLRNLAGIVGALMPDDNEDNDIII